jgi:2-polyprenyl-3-methyl-5-hydroxy-6-metoxy-1,4-benzoquinol methylase
VIERNLLRLIRAANFKAKSAAMRLTKWTGKSKVYIHPKHLAPLDPRHHWYLSYLQPGDRVLDVGCGNGMHSIESATHCAQVIGFDYDLEQLHNARVIQAERRIANAAVLVGNAEESFPFAEHSFDKAYFLDVIEHLERRVTVLREIWRVLKDDGTLLLSAPNRATSWKRRLKAAELPYYSDEDHKIEYTPEELRRELRQGGFEITGTMMPIVFDTPLAGWIDLVGGFSLSAYWRLSQWKSAYAQRHPEESIGWRVACRKVVE